MKQLRIDKSKVTHLTITGSVLLEKRIYYSSFKRYYYKYLPQKKASWWQKVWYGISEFKEGYYKDGEYKLDNFYCWFISTEESKEFLIKNEKLYTKPQIGVYISDFCLKTMYFDTIEEAIKYCDYEFPNINYILNTK